MAAFSRLQLAAALIEYDNDDENPNIPRVSAHESAIFAHLRRNNPRPSTATRTSDYLGVDIPAETDSQGERESYQERKSIDALRNPFGRDSIYGDLEAKEEELEVDLASWGLDALMPKEKTSKRSKAKAGALPNPHPQVVSRPGENKRRPDANRSASLGNIDMFGEGGAFLDAASTVSSRPLGPRRHSIGDPLDAAELDPPPPLTHRRQASEHLPIENIPSTPPLHSVPFPSAPSVRSASPFPGDTNGRDGHVRTLSTASMGSRMLQQIEKPNPFEVRPPSPDRASRFDPKAARGRTLSQGTMGTLPMQGEFDERRSSRLEPQGRTRTVSGGTLGTQMMLGDDDGAPSVYSAQPGRERLYSRAELMRPKVLVMPSPLQGSMPNVERQLSPSISREGFMVSSDGRPLPPGARSANRRASSTLSFFDPSGSLEAPIASNSFTPNPRMSLSLSQLIFRNTLMVDGSRDVAYTDIDSRLRRATEDGEQILPEPEPIPTVVVDNATPDPGGRAPGKLLGRSLIDDLEARKAEMKSKQRTFTGDQRPSMMARSNLKRSSTLIDPESLKQRPVSQHLDSFQSTSNLARRNSKGKTLINFDDEIPGARNTMLGANNQQRGDAKSVFGVDTLWERELAKLREIEGREKAEEEERKKVEATEQGRRNKKKGRGKGKKKGNDTEDEIQASESQATLPEHTPSSPPRLPGIQKASTSRRAPPPPEDDESDSGSDTSGVVQQAGVTATNDWHAGSSDEDTGPRKTTGSGPRYPNRRPPQRVAESDSEEDLPLVATIGRAVERATQVRSRVQLDDSDSDEDKPLTALLDAKLKSPASVGGGSSFAGLTPRAPPADSDEDDQPLGLRASKFISSSNLQAGDDGDDDDKPLAFHPDQVRRTQYAAMAQVQQQQQFMMQAQMHQSMMFGTPSMMGSGFFAPPMAPPMMIAPQPAPAPALNDAAKFGRVDKWRHDVAVEGLPPS